MSRRANPSSRPWAIGGRPPSIVLILMVLIAMAFPFIVAGGGGQTPKLTLEVPKCIPVGEEVFAKWEVKGSLPSGGRYVWNVVGGKGVVQIVTRAFDSDLLENTVRIKGVNPGKIDLLLEYRKMNGNKDQVVASSGVVSTTVDEVFIEPGIVEATVGEAFPLTLVIVPPENPELEFEVQEAVLTFLDISETIIDEWSYAPEFINPPYNGDVNNIDTDRITTLVISRAEQQFGLIIKKIPFVISYNTSESGNQELPF